MTYEIKRVDGDDVSLNDFAGPLMRIITRETEPGKFIQEPVMKLAAARRIVACLKLADALQSLVSSGDCFEEAVVRVVRSLERRPTTPGKPLANPRHEAMRLNPCEDAVERGYAR